MTRRLLTAAVALAAAAGPARAEKFYPMLMGLHPVAVQAGAATKCEVQSRYSMAGTYKVFVTGEGVTAAADPAPAAKGDLIKLGLTFTVAADATPGVRDVRLATALGASTVGQVVVVREPVVAEKGVHNTLATAQPVTLPAALCGAVSAPEEVDVYKFTAVAGEAWTFHCQAQRLQNRIHDLQVHVDPILTLKDSSGTVLAEVDNTYAGDPLLHYAFPRSGEFYLEVRDVRYEGNAFWYYCVEASRRPFVTGTLPVAVPAGKPTSLKLTGYNLPKDAAGTVTVPADAPEGVRRVRVATSAGEAGNPVSVLVTKSPVADEAGDAGDTPDKAQTLAGVPVAVSGRLDRPGDADCYKFAAKKGEAYTFAVVSRACGLAPDANLRLLDAKGRALIDNDDFRERFTWPDPRIETWSAPADGEYVLEVRDLHRRGGPEFVYALTAERTGPHFVLDTDMDKVIVAPGTTAVLFARATRKGGFAGAVRLAVEGLPPGVTASCGRIPEGMVDGCVLFTAAKGTKPTAVPVRVTGTAEAAGAKPVELGVVAARPLQEIYMPGGGRYFYPVEAPVTLSVAESSDITAVKVTPAKVVLTPGGTQKVEVEIERAKDFTANVTLEMNYSHLAQVFGQCLPPGVTVDERASVTALTGGKTKGHIVLKAAPTAAPVEDHQVAVMAHTSINFVMKFTSCGEPLRLTVAKAGGK